MKDLIKRSNEWYENLPQWKGFFFFFCVILAPILYTQYIMSNTGEIIPFAINVLVFTGWRIAYVIILWSDDYKKLK